MAFSVLLDQGLGKDLTALLPTRLERVKRVRPDLFSY